MTLAVWLGNYLTVILRLIVRQVRSLQKLQILQHCVLLCLAQIFKPDPMPAVRQAKGGRPQAVWRPIDRSDPLCNLVVMEPYSYRNTPPNLDAIFAALADPTRRAILTRLASGEASVNELSSPFQMSQPAVSKHLRVLERAGLVERAIDKQRRPARLKAEPMEAVSRWLEEFERFWPSRFDQLDSLLEDLKSTTTKGHDND
jgi:DNA-binding transcriptional ArsR family regulator